MIIIGEKINGSIPSVAKAIGERNADLIRDLASRQAEAGAAFIDVCASVEPEAELDTLHWLIDLVQEATDTPIAIDSPSARVCAEAVRFCKKPGLINSVSMEGDKIAQIFPVIADTPWECVALLCDDTEISKTVEKRLHVFEAIMKNAQKYGIPPERLHIDPLVQMLCTSEDGILSITDAMREIKKRYPAIHITGGASNISFNLPMRKYVNQAFIILSMSAGMDSAILDPLNRDMMGLIYAAEALLGNDEFCMEYIGAYRSGIFGNEKRS
ncbi:MAG: methyltetrahydrofolate cobalamin methyltransferase [Spirochaetaceae bacterium]|jgi:5-methyltetrahydrofolate--homocysteine methyltransferase|nr:methyltetrahydrofolate cobalamin methyltransferase [Spirochaetaceae bacterium]